MLDLGKTSFKIMMMVMVGLILTGVCHAQEKGDKKGVTIIDGRGKDIVLDDYADTFILFPKEAFALLSITQTTEGFIGMNPASKERLEGSVLANHYPKLFNIKSDIAAKGTSFNPNVEEILSMHPDIVYQWSHRGDERLAPMEEVGIPVIGVNWGQYEDDVQRYKLYAYGLGKHDRMDALQKEQARIYEVVQSITSQIPKEEQKDHVFLTHINGNEVSVWGDVLPHTHIHGVQNAAFTKGHITSTGETINMETIFRWDPAIIVINPWWANENLTPKKIMENPMFKNLTAVKEKRVYVGPDVSQLDNSAIICYWYAMVANPEKFTEFNLRDLVKENFKFLYNVDITEEEVDQVLGVKYNKDSAGYIQFML